MSESPQPADNAAPTKCRLTRQAVMPCPAMSDRLGDPHKGGISLLVLFNVTTEEDVVYGINYKRNSRDRGLMLNYCPWCGAQLMSKGRPVYTEEKPNADGSGTTA